MPKKKSSAKKLTKAQQKKLRGGELFCSNTRCVCDTCGGKMSLDYCSGDKNPNTVDIVKNPHGSGGGSEK